MPAKPDAEIAENLHRADLTPLERSEHIAEWVRLTATKASQDGTPLGGMQPSELGIRKAAKELGVNKNEAHRAKQIDGLSPEAKRAALKVGKGDDKSGRPPIRRASAAR